MLFSQLLMPEDTTCAVCGNIANANPWYPLVHTVSDET